MVECVQCERNILQFRSVCSSVKPFDISPSQTLTRNLSSEHLSNFPGQIKANNRFELKISTIIYSPCY